MTVPVDTAPEEDVQPPVDAEPVNEDAAAPSTEPAEPSDVLGGPAARTFTFTPADGSPPITIPAVAEVIPPGKHRWFFWKLRKLEGLEQPIFWLEQAKVPDEVQEQIMLLPEADWGRFYEEWMAEGYGATPGE
jgi:hypothetical protein